MSSIPLISHHLFVAAVNEKCCAARLPVRLEPHAAKEAATSREIPFELLEFGRPSPLDTNFPLKALPRPGSS